MALPFISLVVVNYDGEDVIRLCLDSLINVDYPKNRYEIIVVDNASNDKSISIIKGFSGVKIIRNKSNMGYVGVNSCLGKINGKYIFVLNNDLEMEKKCLKKLVEIIEKDDAVGTVAPKFVNFYSRNVESSGTWVSRAFYNGHYADKNERQRVKEIPYLGIEMLRTAIAKKFGYIYDPDYFIYAEDLDLGLRSRLLGYKTVYVPEAIVYHMHDITMKKTKTHKSTFLLERNLLITFFKIFSVGNTLLLMPYVFLMRFVAIVRDLATLRFMHIIARLKAIFWVIFNFNLIMKKRKEIQRLRKVDDRFVLEVFSEKYLYKKKFIV